MNRRIPLGLRALLLAAAAILGLATSAQAAAPADPYGYTDSRLCGTADFNTQPGWTTYNYYYADGVAGFPGYKKVSWREHHVVWSFFGETLSDEWVNFDVTC